MNISCVWISCVCVNILVWTMEYLPCEYLVCVNILGVWISCICEYLACVNILFVWIYCVYLVTYRRDLSLQHCASLLLGRAWCQASGPVCHLCRRHRSWASWRGTGSIHQNGGRACPSTSRRSCAMDQLVWSRCAASHGTKRVHMLWLQCELQWSRNGHSSFSRRYLVR